MSVNSIILKAGRSQRSRRRIFLGLGERSGIEDIENFAAVFSTAKRSGGDMDKIIQTSARMLGDKIDVRKEIEDNSFCKKTGAR